MVVEYCLEFDMEFLKAATGVAVRQQTFAIEIGVDP